MRKLIVLLGVMATPLPAMAQDPVIWDNGMWYQSMGLSQDDNVYGLYAEMADDFILEQPPGCIVTDVHWLGGYWGSYSGDAHFDWRVRIYDDNNDKPGTPVFDHTYPNAETNETLVEVDGSTYYYEYFVTLADPEALNSGEKYWLSIQGIGDRPPHPGWAMHNDQILLSESMFYSPFYGYPDWTPSQNVFGYATDTCFQITGIPEPASLALLGLGGLLLLRRR